MGKDDPPPGTGLNEEKRMSEIEELREEIAALRAEFERWRTHMLRTTSAANRALGYSHGIGEGAKIRLDAVDGRLAAIEARVWKTPRSP